MKEEDLLPSIKEYLESVRSRISSVREEVQDPFEALRCRSDLMDRLLVSLYRLVEGNYRLGVRRDLPRVALCSQGGYGRKELCLHSDIDILLLLEGQAESFIRILNERLLQNLWDVGLQVGFAVRTVKDCRRWMDKDITVLTSLIDSRFLAGDHELYHDLTAMIEKYFFSKKNQEGFLQRKIRENKEREEKYGGSVYLLEPNLKEGKGGLRDYHALFWLARARRRVKEPQDLVSVNALTPGEFQDLWVALGFLWSTREELHQMAGRRQDQILFEYQEPLASQLGFESTPQFPGVELFMQRYYAEAAKIYNLSAKGVRRMTQTAPLLFPPPRDAAGDDRCRVVEGRLTIRSPDLFEKEPIYLLKIFELTRRLGVEVDDFTREKIEQNAALLDEEFRKRHEGGAFFRDMLSRYVGLREVLSAMNDVAVLGAFLPEFRKLHFRAQHDAYHVYTVDVHSIFAVGELGKILQGDYRQSHPTISQLIQDIEKKDLLAFATLYHDIGKGEGRGHVEKGAPLIRRAGLRLGFLPADIDTLEFLERSHLIMTHLAFRRDLEDQNLIIQFARSMPSLEHLNMLYIQTFCDVKGVSQEAMTDWKASLLEYLYLKTREVIQKGAYTKEKASVMIPRLLEEVLSLFSSDEEKKRCREFFAMMPPRYLLATPPASIVRHVRLWERFLEKPIVFDQRMIEKEACHEVTLLTWENAALFSRMAGLFAAHHMNILEAQLNLSTKGHALQIFKVTDSGGRLIDDPDRWSRVEKDLRDVLEGRVPIEKLVHEKFRPSLLVKKMVRPMPSRVDIDNDLSAFYTVIDVYSQDRTGLLYQITSTLSALGLYVDVSKISTKVDQAADTFYVKDIFGHKITSEERLKKIRKALLMVLETEPTPDWRPPL